MKKYMVCILLGLVVLLGCSCGKSEEADSQIAKYDKNATIDDEGVRVDENGNLLVPSESEEYGKSNGDLVVTTPEVDGEYNVLIYHFPYSTLESIEYEMHLSSEERAKEIYEDKVAAGVPGVTQENNVVRYHDVSSRWIGFKKRDIISNLSETWEKLGYTYVNE